MPTRRAFLRELSWLAALLLVSCSKRKSQTPRRKPMKEKMAAVFRAVNGSPSANMEKVISMMGGIETLVGTDDIVIIKPNLQWFNQGAPNILAMNTLITLIMEKKTGFKGEVVIAENVHRGPKPWETGGWSCLFNRNSDIPGISNYNELAARLKERYGNRFSVCHLVDIGKGTKRVYSPSDGPGCVLCDGSGDIPLLSISNGLTGKDRRDVIMSYPILKTDRGTLVDYRYGVWESGSYTRQPVKFINCAALNHHSSYCGMTSSVKNYLGVSDLTGGSDPFHGGRLTKDYYNFHSFSFNRSAKGPVPGMLGAEVGFFLSTVRKPFLNITTAEYCGLIDRTDLPVAHTRVIAASTDPVALDFHMAKYVLYPNSLVPVHNPENPKSPTYQYLARCARIGGYCFDEGRVDIESFDFSNHSTQSDDKLMVRGETQWGGNFRALLKYTAFRMKLVG